MVVDVMRMAVVKVGVLGRAGMKMGGVAVMMIMLVVEVVWRWSRWC